MPPTLSQHSAHFDAIRRAILAAADPHAAVERAWPGIDLAQTRLIAFGKASVPMAIAAVDLLGARLAVGVVVAPPELATNPSLSAHGLEVFAADHPLPTRRNIAAAQHVRQIARLCPADHDLLLLISGGGSAHMTLPAPPLSLDDLADVTNRLQRAGATIHELNTVRKHSEQLKGGRLAAMSPARRVIALILSDVVGDPLDVIASGPSVADPTTFADALDVLTRHGVDAPAVRAFLEAGARGDHPETPKPGDPALARSHTHIIASNTTTLDAAAACVRSLGVRVHRIASGVEGEARAIGERLADEIAAIAHDQRPAAIVLGGEPTVNVGAAKGRGGPSQELALAAACRLPPNARVAIMAFSTDGRDGPTDAAGAVVSTDTLARARARGQDPERALAFHDSHALLDAAGALIRTGPTGTNVNHVVCAIAYAQ